MKKQLQGFIFWTIAIVAILLVSAIANVLSNLIKMETIMTVVYIALGYSFIYILKN